MMKQMLKKLDAILQLMLEEREERKTLREITALEERDKELVRKAKEHINKEASPVISSAGRNDYIKKGDGDLIPFNLNETDRAILEDFYRK